MSQLAHVHGHYLAAGDNETNAELMSVRKLVR